ncbi:hypothetical protein MCOR02_008634 [Pyricularia oryzae]|nr:hypothetical protein MCOR02_008634 [Pyricularia oryzae]KAI6509468.1 hypothetical protein MCOR13_001583 [Pyricularia oryzae]KAI6644982.1 hypothetical protein MCOR14_000563 [Pyricularia oryzae]
MPPPNTPEEGLLPPGGRHRMQNNYNGVEMIATSTDHEDRDGGVREDYAHNDENHSLAVLNHAPEPAMSLEPEPAALPPSLDWPALEYVGEVSQNLWCPICQAPLVLPVVTRCGHVFCSGCFDGLLEHSNNCCPLDRKSFSRDLERGRFPARPAPRIIQNLLDELQVRCPNRRCNKVETRSSIKRHYERECNYTKVPCSAPSCQKLVARMDAGEGCKHMIVQCPQCFSLIEASDADDHCENDCISAARECEHCCSSVLRHRYAVHLQQDCPEIPRPCEYAASGCTYKAKRCLLGEHERGCAFGAVARMEQSFRREMASLRDLADSQQMKLERQEMVIQYLTERQDSFHRTGPGESIINPSRSMDLLNRPVPEASSTARRHNSAAHLSGDASSLADNASGHNRGDAVRGPWANPPSGPYSGDGMQNDAHGFILAGLTSCEERVESLQRRLAEQDARQSQMLVNEILPVQDQLTELRTAIAGIGMDLRFVIARQKSMYSGSMNRLNTAATNAVAPVGSGTLAAAPEPGSSGQGTSANDRLFDSAGNYGVMQPHAITPPRL